MLEIQKYVQAGTNIEKLKTSWTSLSTDLFKKLLGRERRNMTETKYL